MMSAELLCVAVLNISMPNAEFACEQMEHVVNAAEDLSLEPEILIAMIHYESRWTARARSSGGACGLTQVIPRWTSPRKSCQQLLFPPISIYEGAKMLRRWIDTLGRGSLTKAEIEKQFFVDNSEADESEIIRGILIFNACHESNTTEKR